MLKKSLVTVLSTLLVAGSLTVAVGPADAKNYSKSEKKEFKHWLRAQNHDWRRWMHEQKYHWWKWVHEQKHLFYQGDWDAEAKFPYPGYDSGNGDTGGGTDPGNTGGGDPPAPVDVPRFQMLTEYADLAVRDNETGLIWERSPNTGVINLQGAWQHCARREVGGRMGWRLPAMSELTSLMDTVNPDVANGYVLASGHPFTGISTSKGYWSATGSNGGNFAVWYGHSVFDQGTGGNPANLVGAMGVFTSNHVWCVKGGVQGPSIDKS